jgi:hypothetical protein
MRARLPLKALIHTPAQETLLRILDMNLAHIKNAFHEFITTQKPGAYLQLHLLYCYSSAYISFGMINTRRSPTQTI